MNILMVGRFQYNGVTRHLLTLGAELMRLGHKVDLMMPGIPSHFERKFNNTFENVITTGDAVLIKKIVKRSDLLHLHVPGEIAAANELAKNYSLPCIVTLHEKPLKPLGKKYLSLLNKAPAVICTHSALSKKLKPKVPGIIHIPEGVVINQRRPESINALKAVYITDEGNYDRECYYAVLKAAGVTGLPLEVISHDRPVGNERCHGWTADTENVLADSNIVIASGRSLLEGIANHNSTLIMGTYYNGIFLPPGSPQKTHPEYSGRTGKDPCYRDIIYDLHRIIKDNDYRHYLQDRGYRYVCKYFDIKAVAKQTLKVYQKVKG